MGLTAQVRDIATTLYEDAEGRPELVKQGLEKVGIEKVIGTKGIERVAGWSTRAGISTQIAEVQEAVSPYKDMSKKELVYEGATLVNEKIIQPAREKATPYVAPYVAPIVAKTKEVAAPYLQKGIETKDAVMKDERVQKAVADLKEKFSAVRERPADVAKELKELAVDLIKYEKVGEYREYVCSEKFVTDTTKLVKEDLPQLAKDAARKGADTVQAAATTLSAELGHVSVIVTDAWKKGREEQPELRSWEALRGLASVLVIEVQAGLNGRLEETELDKKVIEMVARIRAVFGLGVDVKQLENKDEVPVPEEAYHTAEEVESKIDEADEADEADDIKTM